MLTSQNIEQKFADMERDNVNMTLVAFLRVMFRNGLRVSDVLKIERKDIVNGANILVKQSKGSLPKLITISSDFEFWTAYALGAGTPVSVFDRYFIYHLLKKYSIFISNGNTKNLSVTHAGRKMLAQNIYEMTKDIALTATSLGHKSTTSTLYYLSDNQRANEVRRGVFSAPVGNVSGITVKKRYGRDYIYVTDAYKSKK